jgi:PAS domain S-box-containing protein
MKDSEINQILTQLKKVAQECNQKTPGQISKKLPELQDLTEKLETYIEKRNQEEENFKRIFENMQDLYYRADMQGRLIMVTPSVKRILGYTPEEIVGKSIADDLYEDPSLRYDLLEKLKNKGAIKNYEVNLVSKNGEKVPILSSSHFIYNNAGEPIGIEGTLTDITERKKAEEKLKENEEKYRSVVENAPAGIFIVDNNSHFIYCNERLSKILGYSRKEIMGMDFRQLLDEKSKELVTDRYKRRQQGEKVPPHYDVGVIRKDGEQRQLEMRVSIIKNKDGITNTIGQVLDITEKKAAREDLAKKEKKLKESEQKYRSLTNQLPVGVYRTTVDGRFIYFNQALANILEYNEKELYNIYVPDLYKDEIERKKGIEYLKKHGKGTTQREIVLKTKNGDELIVNDHINAVVDEKGTIQYFDGVLEDITERKKTEQALKESEEKFRQLAQTTSTAIMVYQSDKWVYANPAAERISGYSLEELQNMYYWEFVAPEHQKMIKERGEKRQQSQSVPSGYEFKIINAKGNIRWVYLEGSLMEYNGKPAGLISVIDITKMKRTEQKLKEINKELRNAEKKLITKNEALKEINQQLEEQKQELEQAKEEAEKNEAKSKSLLEAIPDMIFVFDKKGNIIDYHAEKKDFLYTSADKFMNQNVDDILPENIALLSHEKIKKVLETGKVEEYEYELNLQNKNYIFESRMVKLDQNSTLAIVRDITETKEAQQELIKAKEKAEESDRLKSAFLANMSHEIRTPINGIVGFTQLLRDQDYSKEEQNEFLDIIDTNSNQLLQIVNDIIDISKIEANQLEIKEKTISLNKLMDELYSSYQMELKRNYKSNISFNVQKSLPDGDDHIKTDGIRLKQILSNLLSNAIKFTEKGEIEFGYIVQEDERFLFYVKDTGIGIPKDKHKMIFNHFRRAHESKSSKFGGTGLGLSISKKLVELMGGLIAVDSEEDKGSYFYFTLPVKSKATPITKEEKQQPKSTYDWQGEKILVVEDNPPSQRFIKEILKNTNSEIFLAEKGEKALEVFKTEKDFSIILLDIKLPDKDGVQIAREIRTFDTKVPIIATTAYAMENDKRTALENGFNAYLTKPINKHRLLKIIDSYLKEK